MRGNKYDWKGWLVFAVLIGGTLWLGMTVIGDPCDDAADYEACVEAREDWQQSQP